MTEGLQLIGIDIQSMFDIIYPPIYFSVSNFQISYLSLAPNKNRSGADTISMGNITISLIKVDSGVNVKKTSTC